MPRIAEAEIERIKKQTDLAALVRSRGIELKPHGGNGHLAGKCPFHEEDEASFIVTPRKGLYHCMGCGAAGNAIQFVEKFDGVSFRHAFELLNDGTAAFTDAPSSPRGKTQIQRLDAPISLTSSDADLFEQVISYYQERLQQTPAALEYLKKRGIDSPEAIQQFRLGFADRTLGLRLPHKRRNDGNEMRSRLQKLGLIRKSGHEHFNGSIVMPIFDAQGHVAEIYGRKINNGLRKGTPMHLYLPGPHAGIWNPDALTSGEVVLCEAPLDALTFWVNGLKNATFIYGTEGFPKYLFEALLSHQVKAVRFAYDADDAGNRAADRDAKKLMAHGIDCYRVRFPFGMDVNEYALKVSPAEKSLAVAVKSAEWMGKGECLSQNQEHTPTHASFSKEIAANLAAETAAKKEDPPPTSANSAPLRETSLSLSSQGAYHIATLGPREYRIGGLDKNNSLDVLKIALRIRVQDRFHLDSLDLTRDADRRRFTDRAAEETGLEKELIKRDLGKLLFAAEETLQERLNAALCRTDGPKPEELTNEARTEALTWLKAPDLIEKLMETFPSCGLAGETHNLLAAYLACTSRLLDKPLAVIIQSTSAAGKSTLMEAVLGMFPEEERIKYSAMTGQSLYYLGETNLQHKILAIVEEEGAEKASYALKLLQSEGELTIASTGKDPTTGRMETQEYHVEGPVMIFLTTTAIEIDEELLNRCLVLTVDESKEQTERIHALQRQSRTLEGLRLKKQRQKTLDVLRNAQRLLKPLDVVNPWADRLTFTADRTRTRRDHEKYLTLIDAIALLHQHQRPHEQLGEGEAYITATLDDIALANRLAPELLGRSLDELPPQTRRVYEVVKAIVRDRVEAQEVEQRHALFSRRDLRDRLGWSITQIRAHLERLREMEYITLRCGRLGRSFMYELLTDCNETTERIHIGLLDVDKLRHESAESPPDLQVRQPPVGKNGDVSGGCRPPDRQVESPAESSFSTHLSACSDRTSGARSAVVVS